VVKQEEWRSRRNHETREEEHFRRRSNEIRGMLKHGEEQ
jgi:hypothetical protein